MAVIDTKFKQSQRIKCFVKHVLISKNHLLQPQKYLEKGPQTEIISFKYKSPTKTVKQGGGILYAAVQNRAERERACNLQYSSKSSPTC